MISVYPGSSAVQLSQLTHIAAALLLNVAHTHCLSSNTLLLHSCSMLITAYEVLGPCSCDCVEHVNKVTVCAVTTV